MLVPGRYLFVYGVFYAEHGGRTFEAQRLVFVGRADDELQLREARLVGPPGALAGRLLPPGAVSRRDGRLSPTTAPRITLSGAKGREPPAGDRHDLPPGLRLRHRLPADRRRRYLEVAERGTQYLRDHMRFVDADEDIVYWYHGIDVEGDARAEAASPRSSATTTTRSRCTSRSTRSPARPRPTASRATRRSCSDIDATIELFDRFFLDREQGGYFSHIDPITLDPRSRSRSARTAPGRTGTRSATTRPRT